MNVRVTLVRTIRQYCDVVVPNVSSTDEAEAHVAQQVQSDADRSRLLRGQSWFGDTPLEMSINTSTELP